MIVTRTLGVKSLIYFYHSTNCLRRHTTTVQFKCLQTVTQSMNAGYMMGQDAYPKNNFDVF